jgi:hypothetical protein
MLVVGGVGVAAGAVLFFTSFGGQSDETAQAPELTVGPGSISLRGVF